MVDSGVVVVAARAGFVTRYGGVRWNRALLGRAFARRSKPCCTKRVVSRFTCARRRDYSCR